MNWQTGQRKLSDNLWASFQHDQAPSHEGERPLEQFLRGHYDSKSRLNGETREAVDHFEQFQRDMVECVSTFLKSNPTLRHLHP
jgi:hypothetical protein